MKKIFTLLFAVAVMASCKKNITDTNQSVKADKIAATNKLNALGIVAANDSAFAISTYAGSGTAGGSNGTSLTTAQFDAPEGVAFDSNGNLFIADCHNHVIRKVTPGGTVSIFAGALGVSGAANGSATVARFFSPIRVALDANDNIYVADRDNNRIRKITPAGVVSTIAGTTSGSGTGQFNWPIDVAVTSDGSTVYVADAHNNRIQKLAYNGSTYTASVYAGSGTAGFLAGNGTTAQFNNPSGVAIDAAGAVIVADRNNNCIRKITTARDVYRLAGVAGTSYDVDAPNGVATFGQPFGVTVANDGCIYVTDIGYHNVRRISNHGLFVGTVAGTSTAGFANGSFNTLFDTPTSVAIDNSGNLYVADAGNNRIRKLTPETRVIQYTEGWNVTNPYPGITRYRYTGNRFYLPSQATNLNQNVNVLDIDMSVNHFDFVQVDSTHMNTISNIIGHPTNVLAALSGTFATTLAYAPGPHRHEAAFLRNNNVTYWSSAINPASNYWHYHDGMFYINDDGSTGMELSNLSQTPFSPTLHKYMMSGGPMLINNSVPMEITNPVVWGSGTPNNLRVIIAARSIVALPIINNHVLLICIDGVERDENNNLIGSGSCYVPQSTYYGMTTKDATQFIQQFFHAKYALNMDGGGSASMYLMGAGDNGGVSGGIGVINLPDWDSTCPSDKSAYGQQRNFMRDAITVLAN